MNLNHKSFCPKVIISDQDAGKNYNDYVNKNCDKECIELENAMSIYNKKSEKINNETELKEDSSASIWIDCENKDCSNLINNSIYPTKESFHLIHRYQEFLSINKNVIDIINNPIFMQFNAFYDQLKKNTYDHLQNFLVNPSCNEINSFKFSNVNENLNFLSSNENNNINNTSKNKFMIKTTLVRADCIRKRIKTHFNQYLYRTISRKLQQYSIDVSLCKLSQKFIADVKLESNKLIINKSIKEIFSTDFENKNKCPNKKLFDSISSLNNKELNDYFNKSYSSFFAEYLNSEDFLRDSIKLKEKEGIEYYSQFIKFSKENIEYYEKGIPYRKNICNHIECSNLMLNEDADAEILKVLNNECDDECNNCKKEA